MVKIDGIEVATNISGILNSAVVGNPGDLDSQRRQQVISKTDIDNALKNATPEMLNAFKKDKFFGVENGKLHFNGKSGNPGVFKTDRPLDPQNLAIARHLGIIGENEKVSYRQMMHKLYGTDSQTATKFFYLSQKLVRGDMMVGQDDHITCLECPITNPKGYYCGWDGDESRGGRDCCNETTLEIEHGPPPVIKTDIPDLPNIPVGNPIILEPKYKIDLSQIKPGCPTPEKGTVAPNTPVTAYKPRRGGFNPRIGIGLAGADTAKILEQCGCPLPGLTIGEGG